MTNLFKKKLLLFIAFLFVFKPLVFGQTTYDFSKPATLYPGEGSLDIWKMKAVITIDGVSYTLTCGGNGSFSNTTGGNGGSKALRKDGSGGDMFMLKRSDGQPFQFYSMWVKHSSMSSYPNVPPYYTIHFYKTNGEDETEVDNSSTSSTTFTKDLEVTSVMIQFNALSSYWIDDIKVGRLPGTDTAPAASAVTNTGDLTAGKTLTGSYTYSDAESDTESGSTFKWYRSDNASGLNKTAIAGATSATYTLASADINKYISFEVTPKDGITAGTAAESSLRGPVAAPITVSSVTRSGSTPGNAATVSYTVTFSSAATNVTMPAFSLTTTGLSGAGIAGVSGSGKTYTVTVNTGTGSGTLRLDVDGTDISPGVSNVPYTSGEVYTIDKTAPAISNFAINSGAARTNNQSVSLTVAATDAVGPLQMAFSNDGAGYGTPETYNTSKSWTLTSGDGSKTVYIKVMDAAGNTSTQSATIILDQTPPETTIISTPPLLSNSSTATFTFSSNETAAGFEASLDGGPYIAVTSPCTYTDLSGGSHTVSAKATDPAGNADPTPASYTWTIDRTPPVVTDAKISISGATGTGGVYRIGDTVTATWNNTATGDNNSDIASVTVNFSDFGGGTAVAATNSSGTWTAAYTIVSGGIEGTNKNISVTATDNAGNKTTTSDASNATVDNEAPSAPLPDLASDSDSGISSSDNITSKTTPAITGTAEAGAAITLYDTGGSTVLGTGTAAGGNWSITTSTLSAGTHTITAKAKDTAGNESPVSSGLNIVIDVTAPTLSITSDTSALKAGETATIKFTFSEDPGSTFSWDGSVGDVVVSGGTLGAISGSGLTRTATFTPAEDTNGGTASITVAAGSYTDVAGNNGSAGSTPSLSFDTKAPDAPSAPDLASGSDSGSSNSDNITNDTTPTLSGTAEAGSIVTLYDTGGSTVLGTDTATDGHYTITTLALADGTHTITARAADAAGNMSSASSGLQIAVDTQAPASTVSALALSNDTGTSSTDFITSAASQTLSGTLSADLQAGETVWVSLDNGSTYVIATATSGTDSFSLSGITLSGSSTLKIQVTDAAGNSGSEFSHAYVLDTTAPSTRVTAASFSNDTGTSSTDFITSAVSQTLSGTLSANLQAGETVWVSLDNDSTYVTATATSGTDSFSLSGVTLIGSSTLKIHVTDVAGNSGSEFSKAYVLDTVAPTLTVGTPSVTLTKAGPAVYTVTYSDSTITLGTGDITLNKTGTANAAVAVSGSGTIRTVTLSDLSGDGTLGISVGAGTATDEAGNTAAAAGPSGTFKVFTSAPTDMALSTAAVDENKAAGTVAGSFSTTGPNTGNGDTYTYTLVAGTGDTDNARFTIDGSGKLLTAEEFDYETISSHTYSIRVRTTDTVGLTFEKALTISVNDVNDAPVAVNDTYTTIKNVSLVVNAANGVLHNDTDQDADDLSFDLVDDPGHGSLTANADGSFTYTPSAGYTGSDSFTYRANDGTANSNTATVSIHVNRPVITLEAGSLTAMSTTYGTASASQTFTVSGTNLTAGIRVTPPAGYEVSTDSVTYSSTVTLLLTGSSVTPKVVYIRLKATADAAAYAADHVVLSSTDASDVNVSVAAGTVSPFPVTVTANDVTKTYGDALTGVTNSTAFTLNTALPNGDSIGSVHIAYGTGAAATDGAGAYSDQVTPSAPAGGTFTAGNYNFSYTKGKITVTRRTLTITATGVNKVYDGNDHASIIPSDDRVNNDTFTISYTATFDNKNVGTAKSVSVSGISITGGASANYTLGDTTASARADITARALTVTAGDKTRFAGTPNPELTVSYEGFVDAEDASVLSVQPVVSTTATTASPIGDYPITASGAEADNYAISYVPGVLTVKPGAPTSIALTAVTLYENQPSGTPAGTLNSTSDDPNATFTYSLVSGDGDTDNSLFAISGNELKTAASLNYEQKNTYEVRVRSTTQYGFSLEKSFMVNIADVNEAPALDEIADQAICYTTGKQRISLSGIGAGEDAGQSTSLSVSSSNAGLLDQLTVSGNEVQYRVKNGASGTTSITVTAKDNGGTENGGADTFSRTFTLTVNPLPVVSITSDLGTEISKGAEVHLTATGGLSYQWASAAGILGGQNSATLTVRPSQNTTYSVVVTNVTGCSSIQEITLKVKDDHSVLDVNNIMSPDGDGVNDKLVIKNIDMYPDNEIHIFDRAGRSLYSRKNYNNEWDGTFNGIPLAEGTYFYIVDFGPKVGKVKGYVTIVRKR